MPLGAFAPLPEGLEDLPPEFWDPDAALAAQFPKGVPVEAVVGAGVGGLSGVNLVAERLRKANRRRERDAAAAQKAVAAGESRPPKRWLEGV